MSDAEALAAIEAVRAALGVEGVAADVHLFCRTDILLLPLPLPLPLTLSLTLTPTPTPNQVHLFSSLEGRYNSAAFDLFRARGVTVQLDGDPLAAWAHFAEADVLVVGKSSFSRAAAWLNSRCVVHQDYGHSAPAWVHLKALLGPDRRAGAASLAPCLGRLRSTYHL